MEERARATVDAVLKVGGTASAFRADVLEVTEEQLWPDGGAPHVRDAAVEAVNEGLADLSADRVMSLDQLKARLARRCAERGRARRKVA